MAMDDERWRLHDRLNLEYSGAQVLVLQGPRPISPRVVGSLKLAVELSVGRRHKIQGTTNPHAGSPPANYTGTGSRVQCIGQHSTTFRVLLSRPHNDAIPAGSGHC